MHWIKTSVQVTPIWYAPLQGTVTTNFPPVCLQLLHPEDQNQKVRQMIQQYGLGLTGSDARLALEYYWQAAAVVNASQSVQVLLPLIMLVSCMDVLHNYILPHLHVCMPQVYLISNIV